MDISENSYERANNLAYLMAMESMRWEKDREQSAYTSSSYMITAISILSVTFVAMVPILVSKFEAATNYIFVCLAIILIQLFISLYFTLLVQKRFEYNTFLSPTQIHKYISDHKDWFSTEEGLGTFLETYDVVFKQLKKNNDLRISFLKFSQSCLNFCVISSLFLLVLGILIYI